MGVKAAHPDADAFMILMCDQPLITAGLLNTLMSEFAGAGCLALRPVCRGIPGHPVLIHRSLAPELEALEGDEGARRVLEKLGDCLRCLPVEEDAVILDMDTPVDYEVMKENYR